MDTCLILVPREVDVVGVRNDKYRAECILPYGHFSPHLVRTPEGKYFQWAYENGGCGCCDPDDGFGCFSYWQLSAEEAQKIIKGQE